MKNEPAYPVVSKYDSKLGLTKREYFAGLAMQGMCAEGSLTAIVMAGTAVLYADALLEALNESK